MGDLRDGGFVLPDLNPRSGPRPEGRRSAHPGGTSRTRGAERDGVDSVLSGGEDSLTLSQAAVVEPPHGGVRRAVSAATPGAFCSKGRHDHAGRPSRRRSSPPHRHGGTQRARHRSRRGRRRHCGAPRRSDRIRSQRGSERDHRRSHRRRLPGRRRHARPRGRQPAGERRRESADRGRHAPRSAAPSAYRRLGGHARGNGCDRPSGTTVTGWSTPSLSSPTLARALDALPDGVIVFGGEWTIHYVNPAAGELLGRAVGELTGRSIWIALPELGGSLFHSFLLRARAAEHPITWPLYLPSSGRWLEATATGMSGGLLLVSIRAADRVAEAASEPSDIALAEPDDGGDPERLRFLAEVSEAMIATLDTGESATRLAELVVGQLCDWAVVALAAENGDVGEEAWAHRDPARQADLDTYMTGRLRDTGDDAAMVSALLTGEPVQVRQIHEELVAQSLPSPQVRNAWRRLDTTSCAIVPLRARGETFGALAMLNAGNRPPHTEMQIAVAVEAARRGALALDNARLYGRQQAVAEKLQRSLLTQPPQPDDLQLAVRYRPAGTHVQVGGDWYDAFTQPDGATVAVIGDVVGHDVDAAATMGQIRSVLRGIAYDRPDTPAEVLGRVDGVLGGLHVGSMATALVARVEQAPAQRRHGVRTMRWSSAGHLPPLLQGRDGTVTVLETVPERLLGTGQPSRRTDHIVVLEPGDTVLLYTDGLVEFGRTGIDEGIERLAGALAGLHHVSLDELCDRLLDVLLPCRADDDVALLAVRCHPQEDAAAG